MSPLIAIFIGSKDWTLSGHITGLCTSSRDRAGKWVGLLTTHAVVYIPYQCRLLCWLFKLPTSSEWERARNGATDQREPSKKPIITPFVHCKPLRSRDIYIYYPDYHIVTLNFSWSLPHAYACAQAVLVRMCTIYNIIGVAFTLPAKQLYILPWPLVCCCTESWTGWAVSIEKYTVCVTVIFSGTDFHGSVYQVSIFSIFVFSYNVW